MPSVPPYRLNSPLSRGLNEHRRRTAAAGAEDSPANFASPGNFGRITSAGAIHCLNPFVIRFLLEEGRLYRSPDAGVKTPSFFPAGEIAATFRVGCARFETCVSVPKPSLSCETTLACSRSAPSRGVEPRSADTPPTISVLTPGHNRSRPLAHATIASIVRNLD